MKEFTREDTKFIKGIAIILMFYHHVFCFPERIGYVEYFSLFSFQGHETANIIGSFGKICVALFVFLSGYGTYKSVQNTDNICNKLGKKILGLYKVYWEVLIVFVPVCFIMNVPQVEKSIKALILNFTAVEISYNGEISFFTPFILLMLYTPIILWFSKKINNIFVSLIVVVLMAQAGLYVVPQITNTVLGAGLADSYLYPIIIMPFPLLLAQYLSGIVCAKYDIISKIKDRYSGNLIAAFIALAVIGIVFYMRQFNGIIYDYIYAPVFTTAVIVLFANKVGNIVRRPIEYIGKHSTIMWLSHSFYCYYIMTSFIFMPKFSPLIILLLILITLATSVIIQFVFGKLGMFVKKVNSFGKR